MLAKATAELIGTFWLVLGGCGSAVLAAAFPQLGIGFVGVALAFGLTVSLFPVVGAALAGFVYRALFEEAHLEPPITGRPT